MSIRGKVAKNYKTRFFYVLYSDKTWIFDQSEHAQGPIYVINIYMYIYRKLKKLNTGQLLRKFEKL